MKKFTKVLCILMTLTLLTGLFASCDLSPSADAEEPVAVSLKTDLRDAMFTFTYGELKTVFGTNNRDKLAKLFEDYDELEDNVTIDLNYNDIFSRYNSDPDLFNGILNLLSAEEKAKLSANSNEVLAYYVNAIQRAKDDRPIAEYRESFWTDDDSIRFTQNGTESDKKLKNAATLLKEMMLKKIGDRLLNGSTEAGEDLTDIVYLHGSDRACLLTPEDVVSVISSVTPVYKTASDDTKVVTELTRTVTIILKDADASVEKAFSKLDKAVILEEMKKSEEYFSVTDFDVQYNACKIVAVFNAATDNLIEVTYEKNMIVDAPVTGVGTLAPLGTQALTFQCTNSMYYKFGWENEAK